MKTFGWLLLVIGLSITLFACAMDTSVSSGVDGQRVHNIGLMRDQSNAIMIGIAMLIAGVIMIAFSRKEAKNPRSNTSWTHSQSNFESTEWKKSRDLSDDGYKLYLSKKFKIEKNTVFDKFVLEEQMYGSIEDALHAAHLKDQSSEADTKETLGIVGIASTSGLNKAENHMLRQGRPNIRVYLAAFVVMSIAWFGFDWASTKQEKSGVSAPRNYKAEAEYQEIKKQRMEELKATCMANKKAIEADYLSLAEKGDWWRAGLKVWNCAEATADPDFIRWGNEATTMDNKLKN